MTVQLEPCGQAKARFVGPDGKPVANFFPRLRDSGEPWPSGQKPEARRESEKLAADAASCRTSIANTTGTASLTDADGQITLPDLIPGALYRISDWSTANVENKGVQIRKDFTVKPGETLELGDPDKPE